MAREFHVIEHNDLKVEVMVDLTDGYRTPLRFIVYDNEIPINYKLTDETLEEFDKIIHDWCDYLNARH